MTPKMANIQMTREVCRRLIFALILSTQLVARATADDGDETGNAPFDASQMPSLWSAAMSGSYHVLYQLEMSGSVELIEEWASFNDRLFRLDLINSGGARTSFLTNGHTREMFRYRPFECSRSDGNKLFKELGLIAPMFVGHIWDDSLESSAQSYFVYGLGPLWLRAYKDGRRVERSKEAANQDEADRLPFEGNFNAYDLEFDAEVTHSQEPYRLRFYFAKSGRAEFVDTVDWFLNERRGDQQEKYRVRAKVIQVDYKNELDGAVFKLPVGYGCVRRPDLDPSLQVDIGQVLFHQGTPNQATLEVVSSYPNDDSLQAASWTSQRYSLRVLRLSQARLDDSTKTESYYATLAQFREAPPSQEGKSAAEQLTDSLKPVVASQPKLRRIKRVWWAPNSDEGQATVYTIDQSTGACSVDHQDVRSQVVLPFGIAGSEVGSLADGKQVVFSLDQIAVLFDDFSSFHLIDEGEQFGDKDSNKFRNRFYERRMQHFELKSVDGGVAWTGPVSIVKQLSTYSQYLDSSELANEKRKSSLDLSKDYQIKLILLFYSDQLDRLLFKVVVELLDNHEVSASYASDQLDVSSCFKPEERRDIVVKYPLESVELSRELETKQETIKLLLGAGLFWGPSKLLTPLHVNNIQASFGPFFMRLQMTLLDVPLTHTFQMERGLKLQADASLGWGDAEKAVLEMGASSAELCGQHCEFYNCFKFSFDRASRSCRLALDLAKTKTVEWPSSELYTYFDRRLPAGSQSSDRKLPEPLNLIAHQSLLERPHLSPEAIVGLLEQLVDAAETDPEQQANPLVLRLDLSPQLDSIRHPPLDDAKLVVLRPSAVEHNLETMNEYERELEPSSEEDSTGGSAERGSVVRIRGGRRLRLEFRILYNDKTFSSYTGATLAAATYEQCEEHCELNDCRSFAYCLEEETCQISGQHNEKYLASMTRVTHSERHCNVHVLDYLSKFEPFGLTPRPEENKVAGREEAASASDCATACMDRKEFTCQGFYFCRRPASKKAPRESAVCLLMSRPAEIMTGSREKPLVSFEQSSPAQDDERLCAFFSRSYLAQFDKYLGKRIVLAENKARYSVVAGLQECARSCLQTKCLAFYACPNGPSSLFGAQTCHIVVDSIKREQLVPQKRCTTFVVSDKSHFNAKNLKLVYEPAEARQERSNEKSLGKPDEEAPLDAGPGDAAGATGQSNQRAEVEDLAGAKLDLLEERERQRMSGRQPVAGHSWLARLFSLALGGSLGFGLIAGWNEAYARGWLSRRLPR